MVVFLNGIGNQKKLVHGKFLKFIDRFLEFRKNRNRNPKKKSLNTQSVSTVQTQSIVFGTQQEIRANFAIIETFFFKNKVKKMLKKWVFNHRIDINSIASHQFLIAENQWNNRNWLFINRWIMWYNHIIFMLFLGGCEGVYQILSAFFSGEEARGLWRNNILRDKGLTSRNYACRHFDGIHNERRVFSKVYLVGWVDLFKF